MSPIAASSSEKSRLAVLLEHFARIDDPRDTRRIVHPLAEVLLLVVCGTVADCDDYDHISEWGEAHLDFLRRHLPFEHGVPGGRWLTILMNRIAPALFSAAFGGWVRETWPDRPEFVAIDGKTSRRSHDRAAGEAAIHVVSAFATTSRLVLGQEAVPDKSNELTAIPVLLARLAENGGLRGALVSIDAIATTIKDAGAAGGESGARSSRILSRNNRYDSRRSTCNANRPRPPDPPCRHSSSTTLARRPSTPSVAGGLDSKAQREPLHFAGQSDVMGLGDVSACDKVIGR